VNAPTRGTLAGLAGTAAMTAALRTEQRVRAHGRSIIDYDASGHVTTAAARVLHLEPRTPGQRRALFLLVHWGYGSAAGNLRLLTGRLPGPRWVSALAFYGAFQSMAMTMFPSLGGTPPPWRWRRDLLLSSLVVHAVYAAAVEAVLLALAPDADPDPLTSRGGSLEPPRRTA
jgi:hypothetical protein